MTKLIEANTTIPTQEERDLQHGQRQPSRAWRSMCCRVERPMAGANPHHRRFHLDGSPPAPRHAAHRGHFDIDANGILHVGAKDKATGKGAEHPHRGQQRPGARRRIEDEAGGRGQRRRRQGGPRKGRQAERRRQPRVFQTEKQLEGVRRQDPEDKKKPIEEALERLKEAHKAQDIAAIDKGMEELNTAFQAASKGDVRGRPTGPAGRGQWKRLRGRSLRRCGSDR